MVDSGEALARLQLELLHDALEAQARGVRIALEANSPDKLIRLRAELLAAEAARVLRFAERCAELTAAGSEALAAMLEAARTVQGRMSALAAQSSGMWETHLRASQQAIERAIARGRT
ncbi:MAG TPA: phasin family protein [Burkholderiales bacterium]|jgi:hypothetical protein|nr:phasin family protein [Burkholderiales bacterium]